MYDAPFAVHPFPFLFLTGTGTEALKMSNAINELYRSGLCSGDNDTWISIQYSLAQHSVFLVGLL